MNIFDCIIILFILMFGVVGFKNGLIKEGVSSLGTIIVFVLSYTFKGFIGNILCKILPFFTFSGNLKGLVSINIVIYQLIGFLILFSILLGIYHIIFFASKVLQKIIDFTLVFLLPSKILGAILGLIKGYLIALVVLMVLLLPLRNSTEFENSKCKDFILYKTPIISLDTNDITLSILQIKDLIIQIEKGSITTNDANLQIIDTMLKYKVTDIETVKDLVSMKKLDTIKGIEGVLNKYN